MSINFTFNHLLTDLTKLNISKNQAKCLIIICVFHILPSFFFTVIVFPFILGNFLGRKRVFFLFYYNLKSATNMLSVYTIFSKKYCIKTMHILSQKVCRWRVGGKQVTWYYNKYRNFKLLNLTKAFDKTILWVI